MKLIIYFSAISLVILFSHKETEVSAQGLQPFYGGGPIAYSQGSDNDDIGLLLTVLLLATRDRGNEGCRGCCNCGRNNIPIPYPIAIPTNSPIIVSRYGGEGSGGGSQAIEEINIRTENVSNVEAESKTSDKTKNNNDNVADAQSGPEPEEEN